MLFKKMSNGERVMVMDGHAQPIGLQSPSQQPGLERMKHRSVYAQVLPGPVDQCLRSQDRACCHISMPIEVLGSAVHNQVVTEGKRALIIGRGKRVVRYSQCVGCVCDVSRSVHVSKIPRWGRRGFLIHYSGAAR